MLYVVLLVAGIAVLGTPEGDAGDAAWLEHFGDEGARRRVLAGGLLVVLAGATFLVVTASLASSVAGRRTGLLLGAGTAHGVLVMLAGLAGSSMALMSEVAGMPSPADPDLLRLSDALMFGTLLLPGMLTAGLVAWSCARSGGLPRALAVTGQVVAVLSIAGIVLFPALLWLLWLLAVGVLLARAS